MGKNETRQELLARLIRRVINEGCAVSLGADQQDYCAFPRALYDELRQICPPWPTHTDLMISPEAIAEIEQDGGPAMKCTCSVVRLPKDKGRARILYCDLHAHAADVWTAAAEIADRVALAQGDRTGNDSAIIIRNLCLAKAAGLETETPHDEEDTHNDDD